MEDDRALVENKAVGSMNKRRPLKQSWFQSSVVVTPADLLGCTVTIRTITSVSVDSRGTEDNGSFKMAGLF